MGDDTLQGLTRAIVDQLAERLVEETLVTKADLRDLATRGDVDSVAQRVTKLETAVKGSGSTPRPLILTKWMRRALAASCVALSFSLLGVVVLFLHSVGVPVVEWMAHLSR